VTVRRARATTRLQRPRACPVPAAAALTATVPAARARQPVQAAPAPVLRGPALRPARVLQLVQAAPVPAVPVRVPAETGPRLA
jgi:hypothetical protein